MSLYKYAKRLAHLFPSEWRRRFWASNGRAPCAARWLKTWLEGRATHAEVYDAAYYTYVDECMSRSAEIMADSLVAYFKPGSVVDVGCGSGKLLSTLKGRGVTCTGLEYADAGIELCRSRGLTVYKFDLESDDTFAGRADLVVSTEVAEHLPEAVSDRYVDRLCSISDRVLLTAAQPGQGGTDHVNEQPHSYWIAKFLARGYRYDSDLTNRLRSEWKVRGTQSWYADNVMIFFTPSAS